MNPDDIYDLVPKIACKGLCQDYCGIIGMQRKEYERMDVQPPLLAGDDKTVFLAPKTPDSLTCPLLTSDGKCTDYANRPLICRLWGVTEKLPCPHGCTAERILPESESRTLLALMEMD